MSSRRRRKAPGSMSAAITPPTSKQLKLQSTPSNFAMKIPTCHDAADHICYNSLQIQTARSEHAFQRDASPHFFMITNCITYFQVRHCIARRTLHKWNCNTPVQETCPCQTASTHSYIFRSTVQAGIAVPCAERANRRKAGEFV